MCTDGGMVKHTVIGACIMQISSSRWLMHFLSFSLCSIVFGGFSAESLREDQTRPQASPPESINCRLRASPHDTNPLLRVDQTRPQASPPELISCRRRASPHDTNPLLRVSSHLSLDYTRPLPAHHHLSTYSDWSAEKCCTGQLHGPLTTRTLC